jgi:ATP-dependent Lon protease
MGSTSLPVLIPVLPLRDVVVYPNVVIPLFVGRKISVKALEAAMLLETKEVLLVSQKQAMQDEPDIDDLYRVGTLANILQLLKLPDGTVKVLVEGLARRKVKRFVKENDYLVAEVEEFIQEEEQSDSESSALIRSILVQFEQYIRSNKKIPPEVLATLQSIEDVNRLPDMIAAHLALKMHEKQEILETFPLKHRLKKLLEFLDRELNLLNVQKKIRGRVRKQLEKTQREYYLTEQIKAIQKELGESQGSVNELDDLASRIKKANMPKEAHDKAVSELNKLKTMPAMAAEATVSRNYLDWLLSIPWSKSTKVRYDLEKAYKILNQDHYGLEKVKERFIEFLAVQKRVRKLRGPILVLVGPPGVGKTSLGAAVAKAIGRKFVRVSLGGVSDEADIRGHRKTYIASMPGLIMQKMAKVGVKNPLFMLDEIDKMLRNLRGDPASALLEVLDPEQNNAFNDHYLEVGYDLSEVLFIATANTLDIPAPLLDRMEVIRIPGYTEDEKINISMRHLIPKQLEQNGLKKKELTITTAALRDMIRYYTREAGVRNLEREINKICRKIVAEIMRSSTKSKAITMTVSNLEKYLSVRRFRYGLAEDCNRIGQVTGLAWTEVGGELLTIEAIVLNGKGKMSYTGHLGEVMQESIQAALTVVRSRAHHLGLIPQFYEKVDIHVHVPEGATPKDGPSAGIGVYIALVSALTQIPVRSDVAMTGEITIYGKVLPIGGLKEKLLAAHRGGIRTVIIPEENKRDLKEIPENIQEGLTIHPVRWIDQVLDLALSQPIKAPPPRVSDFPAVKILRKKRKAGVALNEAH